MGRTAATAKYSKHREIFPDLLSNGGGRLIASESVLKESNRLSTGLSLEGDTFPALGHAPCLQWERAPPRRGGRVFATELLRVEGQVSRGFDDVRNTKEARSSLRLRRRRAHHGNSSPGHRP